ncbi:MAG: hypothetical protein CM1200mP35_03600 [Chloroflexota bacterium]|nr:MAG: hypothetical protein CM1200mP35_03600 [Chloroflexota bacterium]
MELAPKALQQVEEGPTGRFLKLGERLAKVGMRDTSRFLSDGKTNPKSSPAGSQAHIWTFAKGYLQLLRTRFPHFLKSLSGVLNRVTMSQLETWFDHGVELLNENPESGLAFFKNLI